MSGLKIFGLFILVVGGAVLWKATFIVDETEVALKFRFGKVVDTYTKPGLYFMTPFVNNVKSYDKRILTYDDQPTSVLTGEKKSVNVDYYVKWRIVDPIRYYNATGGSEREANDALARIIKNALNIEFQDRSISDVIWRDRSEIMRKLMVSANQQVNDQKDENKNYGIRVIDVRIKQVEFSSDVVKTVYLLMIQERKKKSTQHRSEGEATEKKIRAIAKKEETIILAQANRTALESKGQGDAEATRIYAEAYNKRREFYAFYRSLEAYVNSFSSENDVLILDPNSEFFRYFDSSKAPSSP